MAQLFNVGSIAAPGEDFASTGPHLHAAVYDQGGKAINPETARSFLLNRILVGKNRTPLTGQQNGSWKMNFPVTSPFGPRSAPTAGATSDHQGTDIGIPQGTQLSWLANPGDVYKPEKGYGAIQTTDPKTGQAYTVKLLHTTPGGAASVPGQPGLPTSAATGNVYNFYFGGKKSGDSSNPLLSSLISPLDYLQQFTQQKFNPLAMVQAALNPKVDYSSEKFNLLGAYDPLG